MLVFTQRCCPRKCLIWPVIDKYDITSQRDLSDTIITSVPVISLYIHFIQAPCLTAHAHQRYQITLLTFTQRGSHTDTPAKN